MTVAEAMGTSEFAMGTNQLSRWRKEEDLEGDTQGCNLKEKVTKETCFLLSPFFQLLCIACSLGQLLRERSAL